MSHAPSRAPSRPWSVRGAVLTLASLAGTGLQAQQILPDLPDLELPPQTVHSTATPWFLVGHVDGDPWPDVVIGDPVFDRVTIARGGPGGTFDGFVEENYPRWDHTLLGDMDGDGLEDLIIARTNPFPDTKLAIYYADGTGGFAVGQAIPVQAVPAGIALGDVDGDGTDELLYTHGGGQAFSVLASDGTPLADGTTPSNPSEIRVADFDGDGDGDVVVLTGFGQSYQLHVCWNQGGTTFGPPQLVRDLEFVNFVVGMEPARLDGQLRESLAVEVMQGQEGSTQQAPELLLFDLAAGLPAVPVTQPVGTFKPAPFQVGDMNGDGLDDLVLMESDELSLQPDRGSLEVWLNEAGTPSAGLGSVLAPQLARAFVLTDWNLDGWIDAVSTNGSSLRVHLGAGDGSLGAWPGTRAGVRKAWSGHADDDGLPDLYVHTEETEQVLVYRHGPGGQWLPPETPPIADPSNEGDPLVDVLVADVTGDGLDDIVTFREAFGGATLSIRGSKANPDGTFDAPSSDAFVGAEIASVVALEKPDGDFDVLVFDALWPYRVWRVFFIDSTAGAGVSGDSDLLAAHQQVAVGDVDDDGDNDIVLSVDFGVAVSLADPSGYEPATLSPGATGKRHGLELADLDLDGHLDAVSSLASDLELWSGTGAGTFDAPQLIDAGLSLTAFHVDDVDLDGWPDLLVGGRSLASSSFHDITLRRGPTFDLDEDLPLDASPVALDWLDMDGDGRADILATFNRGLRDITQAGPWTELGESLAGSTGFSALAGVGSLQAGDTLTLAAAGAAPWAPAWIILGLSRLEAPFRGGVLVPSPDVVFVAATDGDGAVVVSGTAPAGLPVGGELSAQVWYADAGGPFGVAATIAVAGQLP